MLASNPSKVAPVKPPPRFSTKGSCAPIRPTVRSVLSSAKHEVTCSRIFPARIPFARLPTARKSPGGALPGPPEAHPPFGSPQLQPKRFRHRQRLIRVR